MKVALFYAKSFEIRERAAAIFDDQEAVKGELARDEIYPPLGIATLAAHLLVGIGVGSATAQTLVLVPDRIIDGYSSKALTDAVVLVEGEHITSTANQRTMRSGRFETPTLGELRQRWNGTVAVTELVLVPDF